MRKLGPNTCILAATFATTSIVHAQSNNVDASAATAEAPATALDVPADKKSSPVSVATWESDRSYSRNRYNSLRGGTGLLHLMSADSGAPGTFRISYLSSNYSGTGFLCPTVAQCGGRPASVADTQDSASRTSSDLAISATLLPFLEANVGTHAHGFSDNFGTPSVIQVLGDSYIGLKGFMPRKADRIFSTGAFGNLNLLTSSGDVGIQTANVTLAALGTLDLSNRLDAARRLPLRLHGNVGYLFDNSSKIAEHAEAVRHHPISRIERVGFGINRVDSFFLGFGAEYIGRYLQPFAEWSLDIASNRQGYKCIARNSSPGDICLARTSGMSGTPSRLTLGTRITPMVLGLSGILALDVGTSSTSTFVEERSTELPWNFYLGVGYAFDTAPPKPVVIQAPVPKVVEVRPPEHHLQGLVVDEQTAQPIAQATVLFEGTDRNGLVTKADGSFNSGDIEPGRYNLQISADGYKDGTCEATVENPTKASKDAAQAGAVQITEVKCQLNATPALGVLYGNLADADTGAPLTQATIKVHDDRDRTLELQSDESGNFRVENVPAGNVHLLISSNGYLPQTTAIEIKKKVEQHATFVLRKVPAKGNLKVTAQELKLTTPIEFDGNSADLSQKSMPIVQEVAAALTQRPELSRVDILVYTDEEGSVTYNQRLSEQRADTLRGALMGLGVDGSRLTTKGMGSEKPVVRNAKSEADHAKNRRVRLMISKD